MEILAIAIGNRENIKGITIGGLETKLLEFADDTTAVLSDLDSARALFGLLERFEKASGLKPGRYMSIKVDHRKRSR